MHSFNLVNYLLLFIFSIIHLFNFFAIQLIDFLSPTDLINNNKQYVIVTYTVIIIVIIVVVPLKNTTYKTNDVTAFHIFVFKPDQMSL